MSDKTWPHAWVLWHMYGDGSAAHIERVYLEEQRATEDLCLLKDRPDGHEWKLDKAPIFCDAP